MTAEERIALGEPIDQLGERPGEFGRAAALLDELGGVDDPRFSAIVAFQRGRLAVGDTGRYTVAEASRV